MRALGNRKGRGMDQTLGGVLATLCLAQPSLPLCPQPATRVLEHLTTMVSSLAPPVMRPRTQHLLLSRSPSPRGQEARGGPWNSERPWEPAPSLMCPQWMGTPTSSSKSQRKMTPSASTLTKNQAQCCASLRTPSQVQATVWGWSQNLFLGRPGSPQGRHMDQVLTVPITHLHSYADYILE